MVIDEDFYLFWFLKFTDELGFDSENGVAAGTFVNRNGVFVVKDHTLAVALRI